MADVQAWANQIAQQLFDGPQDLANEAAANVTDASGLAFFVGKPNGSSGQWTLKKLTPTELGKLVYNYLTTQSIAQQLASVLGEATFLTYDNVQENPTNELDDIRGIKVINWNSASPWIGTSVILSISGTFLPGHYERGVQIRFYNKNITSNPTTVKYRVRWGNSGWGEWSDI